MSVRPFTLHVRMTKQCNADCTYCSSFETVSTGRMSVSNFKKAVRFVFDEAIPRLGAAPTHMTAQYIGGEILTYPHRELAECVSALRAAAEERRIGFRDGCQSNLIGSPEKVDRLYSLFEGRLGTSVDSYSDARTVGGSAERYRLIWKESDQFLRQHRSPTGAVYVLDKTGLQFAADQMMEAMRQNRMLTLRPVFQGGTPDQALLGPTETRDTLTDLFDRWFMKMPIIVEPFFHMTNKQLASRSGLAGGHMSACAFQADCTKKSLSLEPNGDLYVCQEMADAGMFRIGNAIKGEWDDGVLQALSARENHLAAECVSCPYFTACQGGCMFESLQQGRGIYGKSYHCASWKSLFQMIDQGIDQYGHAAVSAWLARLEERQSAARNDGLAQARIDAITESANA
jgi:radical SAM protein with 4Fe4S-binding SPASM domain